LSVNYQEIQKYFSILFVESSPVITKIPINTSLRLKNNNTNVSLTCEADGASSYYWQRQHGSIPSSATGVNTSNLTIVNLQLKDAGYYQCVAINDIGSTESEYAKLTITGTYIAIHM